MSDLVEPSGFFREDFWLPANVTWSQLKSTSTARYAEPEDLIFACAFVLPMLLIRWFLIRYPFRSFGRWCGLKENSSSLRSDTIDDVSGKASPYLSELFAKRRRLTAKETQAVAKQTDLSPSEVARWFRHRRSLSKPVDLDKFSQCCLHFTWYSIIFGLGVLTLHKAPWLFDSSYLWKDYPNHRVDFDLRLYYMLSVTFYMSEVVSHIHDIKRKDSTQMLVHHVVTLCLLWCSYWINHCRIGSIVLVIHDCADIFLNLGKMAKYVGANTLCDAAFAAFSLAWFLTRIVFFPLYPLYSIAYECRDILDYPPDYFNIWHLCLGLLIILLVMNVLWFLRIVKAVVEKFSTGKTTDNRSDTESSGSSEDGIVDRSDDRQEVPEGWFNGGNSLKLR